VSARAPDHGLPTEALPEVVAAPSPPKPAQQPAPEPVTSGVVAGATPTDQTAELSAEELAALQNADTQLMPSPFDEPEPRAQPEVAAPQQPVVSGAPHPISDSAEPADVAGPTSGSTPAESAQDSAILPCYASTDTLTRQVRAAVGYVGALWRARHGSLSQARSSLCFVPPTAPPPRWIDRS